LSHIGVAVTDGVRHRWTYLTGSSRRRLPSLLADLKGIELFVHDRLHSERNVRFELDRAWAALPPSGAVIVDDIDSNWGFSSFTKPFSRHNSMVCEAEPLGPDRRRFNQKGLFGIILKSGLPS
jgi:Methyltransferase domain